MKLLTFCPETNSIPLATSKDQLIKFKMLIEIPPEPVAINLLDVPGASDKSLSSIPWKCFLFSLRNCFKLPCEQSCITIHGSPSNLIFSICQSWINQSKYFIIVRLNQAQWATRVCNCLTRTVSFEITFGCQGTSCL